MRILFAFAAIITLLVSCENAKEEVTTVANGFLTSYFQMDYEKAATYCTDELAGLMMSAVASKPELPDELQELLTAAAKATVFTIKEVDTESVEDQATVIYDLLLYKAEEAAVKKLTLTKSDGEWKVSDVK